MGAVKEGGGGKNYSIIFFVCIFICLFFVYVCLFEGGEGAFRVLFFSFLNIFFVSNKLFLNSFFNVLFLSVQP